MEEEAEEPREDSDSDSEIELEDEVFEPNDNQKDASDEEIELEEEEFFKIKSEKRSDHHRSYICGDCGLKATTEQALKTHIEAKHESKFYSCSQCDFKTTLKRYLKPHINVKHKGVKRFSCSSCDFKTAYKVSLILHEKRDHSEGSLVRKRTGGKRRRRQAAPSNRKFVEVQEGPEDPRKELKPGEWAHTPDQEGMVWCQFEGCDFRSKYCLNVTRHEQAEHQGIRYKCDRCEFTAKQRGTVLMHANKVHDGILYNCETENCHFNTPFKSYLIRHLLEKHGVTSDGKKRGAPQPYSKRRVKDRRTKKRQYSCERCCRNYKSSKGLKLHRKNIHEAERLPCNKCDFRARSEEQLASHNQRVHEGLKYSCELCEYISSYKKYVKIHSARRHPDQTPQIKLVKSDEKNLKCPHCDFSTISCSFLNKHLRVGHKEGPESEGKERKCPHCEYRPSTNQLLETHLRRRNELEQTETKFQCNLCEHVNCLKRGLLRHKTLKHGKRTKNSVKKEKTDDKSHNCPSCKRKFKLKQTLFVHQKDSHGKTDFLSCDDCRFIHTSEIQLRLHSTKIQCEKCDFKTCTRYNLKSHISKVHRGAKISSFKLREKQELVSQMRAELEVKKEKVEAAVKVCDKCDYKTSDNDDYYDHVLEHLPSNTSQPQKLSNITGEKRNEKNIESFKTDVRNILQSSTIDTNKKTTETIDKAVLQDAKIEDENCGEGGPLAFPDSQAQPTDNKEEVAAAVGFLMCLGAGGGGGGFQEKDDNNLRKCEFGCDERFSTEEEFFIHITDYHNNF